jgi:hypothetical protein
VSLDLTLRAVGTFAAATSKHAPIAAFEPVSADLRSVGELLVDADHHARTLLLDADAEAASALLRAWGSTVRAAAAVWEAFPQVKGSAIPDTDPFPRVREIARSVDADLATSRWPGTGTGSGAGDHRMHAISGNLTQARELVDKYGGELQPHLPRVHKDLEAARTRVVHTLYIVTHGVLVALNEDGRQRAADPNRTEARRASAASSRGRYEVGPGVRWADRLGVAERALGSYLQPSHYAEALAHEQVAPVVGHPRLREALARFDIQAHRTLVDAPNAGNLVLATRTEGMFFGAALVLARAAAEAGYLDRAEVDPARLEYSLSTAGEAWMGLARRWRDLMPQSARLDPALATAAAQLRAACRELTHDGDQIAPASAIARRVDLAEALPVIARYVDAAAELAEATRPPLRDPGLVAPSRAVVRRLAQDIEDGLVPDTADAVRSDLITIAVRENRLGPVPAQLLDALDSSATGAARAASSAASAMTPCLARGELANVVTDCAQPARLAASTAWAPGVVDASSFDVAPPRGGRNL